MLLSYCFLVLTKLNPTIFVFFVVFISTHYHVKDNQTKKQESKSKCQKWNCYSGKEKLSQYQIITRLKVSFSLLLPCWKNDKEGGSKRGREGGIEGKKDCTGKQCPLSVVCVFSSCLLQIKMLKWVKPWYDVDMSVYGLFLALFLQSVCRCKNKWDSESLDEAPLQPRWPDIILNNLFIEFFFLISSM